MSDIESLDKELKEVKKDFGKRISTLEKKINKISWGMVIACGLVVLLLCGFFVWLMFFTWQKNDVIHWPNMVILVSTVTGIVAIVITALVMLTRRNSEE